MPTPSSATTAPTISPSVDPFAGPAPVHANSTRPPKLPGRPHAWTYMVSPEDLCCVAGHIVPDLRRASHQPGTCGNTKVVGRGEGARAYLMGLGYVEVPHDIETTAFGQLREGYMVRHETRMPDGSVKVSWTDCWRRPVSVGRVVRYEDDTEGRLAFMLQALALVAPGGLSPAQIEMAMADLVSTCRELAMRDDTRGQRHLVTHLAQLPYEHAPPDLQSLMVEHGLGPEIEPTNPKKSKSPKK